MKIKLDYIKHFFVIWGVVSLVAYVATIDIMMTLAAFLLYPFVVTGCLIVWYCIGGKNES